MDHSCAADSLRWKWPMVYDLIHSLALHLSNASRSSSQELRQSRTREEEHSRVLALYDICAASWHALLPEDEPIAMYPPLGEEEAGYMWQMKRAMCGTRRKSRLFQEEFSKKQDCSTQGMSLSLSLPWDGLDGCNPQRRHHRGRRTREFGSSGCGTEAMDSTRRDTSCKLMVRDYSGWKIRSILLRSSETVSTWARSHRAPRVARTSGKAIQKRWTSWKRWKKSCISKIQASVFTCPVEDSTYSSV